MTRSSLKKKKKITDKQRLDWLRKGEIFLVPVTTGWITHYVTKNGTHYKTPRQAIDSEIRKSRKP